MKSFNDLLSQCDNSVARYSVKTLYLELDIHLDDLEKAIPYLGAGFSYILRDWVKFKKTKEVKNTRSYFTKLLKSHCNGVFHERQRFIQWFNNQPDYKKREIIRENEQRCAITKEYERIKANTKLDR